MMRFRSIATLLLLAVGAVAPADAALVAYEGFDYAAGSTLAGQSGGSGFAGAWAVGGFNANAASQLTIQNPSLFFSSLQTSGNHATSAPQNFINGLLRSFAAHIDENDTATRYLSVLLRPEGTLHQGVFNGFFGIYLDGTADFGDNDVFIGKPGGNAINEYVVEDRGGSLQHASGVTAVINQTAFLVLKAELQPGIDKFTLYVDSGAAEPASGTVKNDLDIGDALGLVIYSTGAFSVDEIRWGETYADVAPFAAAVVPLPPAAIGALILGPLVVIARRRRA